MDNKSLLINENENNINEKEDRISKINEDLQSINFPVKEKSADELLLEAEDESDAKSEFTEVDKGFTGSFGSEKSSDNELLSEKENVIEDIYNISEDQFNNYVPDEPVNVQTEKIKKEEIDFESLSPAGKVHYMLKYNSIEDAGFKELYDLSAEITRLNLEASKENVSPEAKKKLAAAGIDFHIKLSEFLGKVQKDESERFNTNASIASLVAAYNINSNLTVETIESLNGDVFPALLDRAFDNMARSISGFQHNNTDENRKNLENDIAKAMYLAKLKNEYDNVYGTEEEQKAWKAEILNEIFSDRFAANVEEFKKSKLYERTREKFGRVSEEYDEVAVKRIINETAIELAEEKYHESYQHIVIGFKNDEEKERFKKNMDEIDEIRAIAANVGERQGNESGLQDFVNHPAFDTMYLKKRAKLYGEQKNLVGELRREKEKETAYEVKVQNAKKSYVDALKDKFAKQRNKFDDVDGIYTQFKKRKECDDKIKNLASELNLIQNTIKNLKAKENELKKEKKTLSEEEKETLRLNEKKMEDSDRIIQNIMIQKAETSENISKYARKYSMETVSNAEKEYLEYLENTKNFEALKKAEEEKAVRFVNESIESDKRSEDLNVLIDQHEVPQYKIAVEQKDTDKLDEIKNRRYTRDYKYKKENIELYAPVKIGDKEVFVSRSAEDAKYHTANVYAEYKQTYNINDEELDKRVEDNQAAYDEKENLYRQKGIPVKPDRSTYKIQAFVPKAKVEIEDLDLRGVEIAREVSEIHEEYMEPMPRVTRFTQSQLRDYGFDGANDAVFANALDGCATGMSLQKAFLGTDEYKDIVNGLREFADSLRNVENPGQEMSLKEKLDKCLFLHAQLNHYIDRKNDEKESVTNEKSTAANRRLVAQSVNQTVLRIANEIKKQDSRLEKDYSFRECAADLGAMLKLTGNKDRELTEILANLKEENYEKSLTGMYKYLSKNAAKYRNPDGTYKFRLSAEEKGGKRRYFPSDNGKIFKTVFLGFERLEKSYLEHISKKEPYKLPGALYHAKRAGANPAQANSLNQILGTRVNLQKYEDYDLDIKSSDNLADHIQQFENRYLLLMNIASFQSADDRYRLGRNYMDTMGMGREYRTQMVDSALSVYFLKSWDAKLKQQNRKFDLEEAETERKKFVSAIRKSSAYRGMEEAGYKFFDLGPYRSKDIEEANREKRELINTTDKFKELVIANVLAETVAKELNESAGLLYEEGKLKKEVISRNVDNAGYNLKIAKALGVSERVEPEAQRQVIISPLKGTDIKDTLKKTGNLFAEKTVMKNEQLTQGVKPVML